MVIEHISTKLMIADPMTKGMRPLKFKDHVDRMGLGSIMWFSSYGWMLFVLKLYLYYDISDGRDSINLHVVCDVRNKIIFLKKYKHFVCITTHTCKRDRHITYINLKFNFNGKRFKEYLLKREIHTLPFKPPWSTPNHDLFAYFLTPG